MSSTATMKTDLLDIRHMDCMDLMAQYPDKHFDLAIVDPPYGINVNVNMGRRKGDKKSDYHKFAGGDTCDPGAEYFDDLRRVSKNQIVWGANHFAANMPNPSSPCWVIWDKENGEADFADCELAYTTFRSAARIFRFRWQGMLQGNMQNKEQRIHPTQKPVALYNWLLANYSEPGQTILDTHLGSGSIAIACHYNKNPLVACELDADYYEAACKRIKQQTAQLSFDF